MVNECEKKDCLRRIKTIQKSQKYNSFILKCIEHNKYHSMTITEMNDATILVDYFIRANVKTTRKIGLLIAKRILFLNHLKWGGGNNNGITDSWKDELSSQELLDCMQQFKELYFKKLKIENKPYLNGIQSPHFPALIFSAAVDFINNSIIDKKLQKLQTSSSSSLLSQQIPSFIINSFNTNNITNNNHHDTNSDIHNNDNQNTNDEDTDEETDEDEDEDTDEDENKDEEKKEDEDNQNENNNQNEDLNANGRDNGNRHYNLRILSSKIPKYLENENSDIDENSDNDENSNKHSIQSHHHSRPRQSKQVKQAKQPKHSRRTKYRELSLSHTISNEIDNNDEIENKNKLSSYPQDKSKTDLIKKTINLNYIKATIMAAKQYPGSYVVYLDGANALTSVKLIENGISNAVNLIVPNKGDDYIALKNTCSNDKKLIHRVEVKDMWLGQCLKEFKSTDIISSIWFDFTGSYYGNSFYAQKYGSSYSSPAEDIKTFFRSGCAHHGTVISITLCRRTGPITLPAEIDIREEVSLLINRESKNAGFYAHWEEIKDYGKSMMYRRYSLEKIPTFAFDRNNDNTFDIGNPIEKQFGVSPLVGKNQWVGVDIKKKHFDIDDTNANNISSTSQLSGLKKRKRIIDEDENNNETKHIESENKDDLYKLIQNMQFQIDYLKLHIATFPLDSANIRTSDAVNTNSIKKAKKKTEKKIIKRRIIKKRKCKSQTLKYK